MTPLPPPVTTSEGRSRRLSSESGSADGLLAEEETVTPALVRMSLVAGLGGVLFGYDTGVTSGALITIRGDLGWLSAYDMEAIVSSALVGAFVGSLVGSRIADSFGRKMVIIVSAVVFMLGALEQAFAARVRDVIIGRLLVGLGVGASAQVIPIYLSELSPSRYRGRMVASLVVLVTGGQVIAYAVDAIFAAVPHGWRWMFGLGAVPALLQLLLCVTIPESPRYAVLKGNLNSARKTLESVYPRSTPEQIQHRIDLIQLEVHRSGEDDPTSTSPRPREWVGAARSLGKKLWRNRANRRAIILSCGLQFFQQATGFNTLMYYSGTILEAARFSNPAGFSMAIAGSNFLATIVSLRLIDSTGRRNLLLATLPFMAVGMGLMAVSFHEIPHPESFAPLAAGEGASLWAYISLLSMVLFVVVYAVGLGPVPWVVQSEVFDQDLRAIGTGLATATNWFANLVTSATFLSLSDAVGPSGAFGLYGVIAVIAWLFVFQLLPETKGLSLEETRALFDSDNVLAGAAAVGRQRQTGGYSAVQGDDPADEQ